MAATFSVFYDFGGTDNNPGTAQNIDALGPPCLRFKQADNATIDSVNPVPIPAAGTNYSYWKQIYLKCSVAPATQVNNVRFYTDGTGFGTGITLNVGLQFPVHNSGATTGYDVADVAGDMITDANKHTDLTTKANAFGYTSGATLTGPTISEAGSLINLANETTNYLVLQIAVGTTAGSGDKTDETLTFIYDEI